MQPALYLLPLLVVTVPTLIWAEMREARRWVYVTKPLSTLLVIAAAALSLLSPSASPLYTWGVLVGLLLSLGGDVALMLPGDRAFLAGLVLFLLAHVAYIVTFTAVALAQSPVSLRAVSPLSALAIAGVSLALYRFLADGLGPMKGPVIAYTLVISLMVNRAFAIAASPAVAPAAAWMVALGAVSFYVSDAMLAVNRFGHPYRFHHLSLAFYYGGQYLIALAAGYMRG